MFNVWLKETQEKEQEEERALDEARIAQMEEEEEMDDGGEDGGATFQTWIEYMASLGSENDFVNPDFSVDPVNINSNPDVQARELRNVLSRPIYDNGKERKPSQMFFFKEDFDPKLYLAHMHQKAMDTSLIEGVEFLGQQLGVNEQKAHAAFASQFHRFVRCKYVMDGFAGEGPFLETIQEVTDPMDSLKATFSDAYDNSLTTLKPIHERQEEIEHQQMRLRTIRKFKGEFAQASKVKKAIDNFPAEINVVVTEWKLSKAKRSENAVRKSSMMADVNEFLGALFDEARAKILELLVSDDHNQNLTHVEDYITALLNL